MSSQSSVFLCGLSNICFLIFLKETGDCSLTLKATLVENMHSIRMWPEVGESNEGVR